MFLLLILGGMVAVLVINGLRSQAVVTSTVKNTGEMQNAASGIAYDVRYAKDVKVSTDGTLLRTKTWVGDPDAGAYTCRAWIYDAAKGELRRTTDTAKVVAATASSSSSWTIAVSDVVVPTGTKAFVRDESAGTVKVFIDGDPDVWGHGTRIDTTVLQRPQADEAGVTCW
ncbi:hypothetical protein [Demequina litorisediminis]|nr:hypothetical protein [Demequina litorisediminis]